MRVDVFVNNVIKVDFMKKVICFELDSFFIKGFHINFVKQINGVSFVVDIFYVNKFYFGFFETILPLLPGKILNKTLPGTKPGNAHIAS